MSTDAADVPSKSIVELARAKINLTLRVLGRRSDGYHELSSIVAFADVGDSLTFEPSPQSTPTDWDIEVVGPYAGAIEGENLIDKAVRLIEELGAPVQSGRVVLVKKLPVASGIGGGSADAAALLRALRHAAHASTQCDPAAPRWPAAVWLSLAARIGADVPVCLLGQSCLMRGIGEDIAPLELPSMHAVLLTPDGSPSDKTRRVFEMLGAKELGVQIAEEPAPSLPSVDAVVSMMKTVGNDLEPSALAVMPQIAAAKSALIATPGCLHAFLSGAGPTCVGVYETAAAANVAALSIARSAPTWWVTSCKIGD